MNQIKSRIRQYTAALLVAALIFTQQGIVYAQSSSRSGYWPVSTATASDGAEREPERLAEIPVTPEDQTNRYDYDNKEEAEEISIPDNRQEYEKATMSDATDSNAGVASPSDLMRRASETYIIKYRAVVDGNWEIIYEEEVCEGDDGVPPEVPHREGYTFSGWNRDYPYVNVRSNCTVHATYVTGDVDLHVVNFLDANDRPVVNAHYVKDGDGAKHPQMHLYDREGYVFIGWDQLLYSITGDLEVRPKYLEGNPKVYWVSYQAQYNGWTTEIKYEATVEGEDGEVPEVPDLEGYTFSGWNRDYPYVNVRSNRMVFATYVTGDVDMHVVTYLNADDRLVVNPEYVKDGGRAKHPHIQLYDREGYVFVGWDQPLYEITGDLEVRSKYLEGNPKVYWVSYQAQHNGEITEIKYEATVEGEDGEVPEVPYREGYTFSGWKRDYPYVNVRSNCMVFATYMTGDVDLHVVTYLNADDRLVVNPEYVKDGGRAKHPHIQLYDRDGYVFVGWDQPLYEITGDLEVGSKYLEGNPKVYCVSYQAQHNGETTEIKYEATVEGKDGEVPEVPYREGYTFSGWKRDHPYVNVRSNRTVFATYISGTADLHVVRFVNERGRLVMNPEYVPDGKRAASPSRELYDRTGHTFLGWDREFYQVTGDMTIRPRYTKGEQQAYWLTYYGYANDSMVELKREWVPAGGNGSPPEVPPRSRYTFTGWGADNPFLGVTSSRNLYANYAAGDETVHVVYFYGKKTGSNDYTVLKVQYVRDGESATPPELPEYAGHTFRGWQGDYENITLHKSIFAVYDSQMYTVNFWNGETLLKSQKVQHGSWAIAPEAPEAPEGYYFSGWDKDYWTIDADLDIYPVFVPAEGAIILGSTEEFKREIRALDLPDDFKEDLIDLGLAARSVIEENIDTGSRSRSVAGSSELVIPSIQALIALIPLILSSPPVLIALAVVVGGCITYYQVKLTWEGMMTSKAAFDKYVGKPVADAITAELTLAIAGELVIDWESENIVVPDSVPAGFVVAATAMLKMQQKKYYVAYLDKKVTDNVYVGPQISEAAAISIILIDDKNLGVFTLNGSDAGALVRKVGPAIDDGYHGNGADGYYKHYHVGVSKDNHREAHVWYFFGN